MILVKGTLFVARIIYFFIKLVCKPRNKITMLSRQSNEIPLNFSLIKDALKRIDSEIEVVILAHAIGSGFISKLGFCLHTFKQMCHIATSKIVIVDGFCIPVSTLNHKQNQSFIQIWHALNIIKKFGYLALDKPAGVSSKLAYAMRMHYNYTYVASSSKAAGEILKQSFQVADDAVIQIGVPYIDYIQEVDPKVIQNIYAKYPGLRQRKIILYAPTFRKNYSVDLSWITNTIDLDEYSFVIKLHPMDRKKIDNNIDSRIIIDNKYFTYQWLWICDKVITDYSGVSLEAALLNKELFFYLYDIERYEKETGLNVDLYNEPVEKYTCETPEKLARLLEEKYDFDVLNQFKNKYLEVETGKCSMRFAEWLKELME